MIKKSNYLLAASWFILHITFGIIFDVIVKKMALNVPIYQIVFLSFAFSAITLIPFLIYKKNYRSNYNFIHIFRGALLCIGIAIKCLCLKHASIITVNLISFTNPLFFLILSYFLLNEKASWKIWIASLLGFFGAIIALNNIEFSHLTVILLLGSFILSALDIINKKYIIYESKLNMVFYLSLYTALFSLLPILYIGWIDISISKISIFIILGIILNAVFFSLFRAFSLVKANS